MSAKKSFRSYYSSNRTKPSGTAGSSGVLGSGDQQSRSRSIFGGAGGFLRTGSKGGDSLADTTLKSNANTTIISKGVEIEEDRIALGTAHSSEQGDHNGVQLEHGVPEEIHRDGSFFDGSSDEAHADWHATSHDCLTDPRHHDDDRGL